MIRPAPYQVSIIVAVTKMLSNLFRLSTLVAIAASSFAAGQTTKPIILAYYPSDDAYSDLVAMHSYINQISTDVFAVDAKGNITGTTPTQALKVAASDKIQAYAVFSNYGTNGFDAGIAHSVMTNKTYKAQFLASVKSTLSKGHYQGVNIDFEGFLNTDRSAFTAFLKAVEAEVKPSGFRVVVSVPAKSVDDPTDSWTGGFDFISIGKIVDIVQVMTYDEYGTWSTPGSVAGLDWMTACLKYAASAISPTKVLLGLPAYGNDWDLSDATGNSNVSVVWKDVPALLKATGAKPIRDEATYSMHYRYTAPSGSHHEVWYEDATSISSKAHLFVTFKLGGASVWALGQEDCSFWKAVGAGMSSKPNPLRP